MFIQAELDRAQSWRGCRFEAQPIIFELLSNEKNELERIFLVSEIKEAVTDFDVGKLITQNRKLRWLKLRL